MIGWSGGHCESSDEEEEEDIGGYKPVTEGAPSPDDATTTSASATSKAHGTSRIFAFAGDLDGECIRNGEGGGSITIAVAAAAVPRELAPDIDEADEYDNEAPRAVADPGATVVVNARMHELADTDVDGAPSPKLCGYSGTPFLDLGLPLPLAGCRLGRCTGDESGVTSSSPSPLLP